MTVEELITTFEKESDDPYRHAYMLHCHTVSPTVEYCNWLEQQLIEMKKQFAVSVEVPEALDKYCSLKCLFLKEEDYYTTSCKKGWGVQEMEQNYTFCKPGPGCPSYNGGE